MNEIRWGLVCAAAIALLSVAVRAQPVTQYWPLPQGLTCGVSYVDYSCLIFGQGCTPFLSLNNSCNGVQTIKFGKQICPSFGSGCGNCNCDPQTCIDNPNENTSYCTSTGVNRYAASGWANVSDRDWGNQVQAGIYHQELVNGDGDSTHSTSFAIPRGATCGFHHTIFSPGHMCLGYNPGKVPGITEVMSSPGLGLAPPPTPGTPGCPLGWTAGKAFDMSSTTGYWVWCEYQDPNGLSNGSPSVQPLGISCGMSDNFTGTYGNCMGVSVLNPLVSSWPICPANFSGSVWLDSGASSGIGLGLCTQTVNPLPSPPPPPPPPKTCPAGTLDCCGDATTCRTSCNRVYCP